MTAATELANEFSIHKSRYEMMIVGKMRSNFDVHPGGQACRFLLQKGGTWTYHPVKVVLFSSLFLKRESIWWCYFGDNYKPNNL